MRDAISRAESIVKRAYARTMHPSAYVAWERNQRRSESARRCLSTYRYLGIASATLFGCLALATRHSDKTISWYWWTLMVAAILTAEVIGRVRARSKG
jgi:hypothetical protein